MDDRLHVRNILHKFTYRHAKYRSYASSQNAKSEITGMRSIRTSNPLRGLLSSESKFVPQSFTVVFAPTYICKFISATQLRHGNMCNTFHIHTSIYTHVDATDVNTVRNTDYMMYE